MRIVILLALMIPLSYCKPRNSSSEVASTPRVGNEAVAQGGLVVVNHCNPKSGTKKGHEGNVTYPQGVQGWKFDEREGCFLDCKDEAAAKADFLSQLKNHRTYGDPKIVEKTDPQAAELMRHFAKMIQQKNKGVAPHSFASLTTENLYDGSKWTSLSDKPKVGDIFLNMTFGQPNHAGIFYSKRGLAHARLVVAIDNKSITLMDSGWGDFTVTKQVASQTVWIRPKSQYFSDKLAPSILKWATAMKRSPYDSNLYDDWVQFRGHLNGALDQGMSESKAAAFAFDKSSNDKFAPGGTTGASTFAPPSGLYCSEGPAAIFAYMGFRLFGENPLDIIRLFGNPNSLPEWGVYADALSGFGADEEEKSYMMHKLFYSYFEAFDRARKLGAINVEGVSADQLKSMTIDAALEANFKAYTKSFYEGVQNPEGSRPDPMAGHIETLVTGAEQAVAANPESRKAKRELLLAKQLKDGLAQATQGLASVAKRKMNTSDALYFMFYANQSYGPHTFFENSKYFDFKGVFYNSDLKSGYQALFISDWWLNNYEIGRQDANIQTTLYRYTGDASLGDKQCKVSEKAPLIRNKYSSDL